MEEILIALLQGLFEAVVWIPLDAGRARTFGDVRRMVKTPGELALSTFYWFLFGLLIAAISLWLFPKAMMRNDLLRTLQSFAAPFLAGYLAGLLARRGARSRPARPRLGFWRAFFFTVGFSFTRLIFAR